MPEERLHGIHVEILRWVGGHHDYPLKAAIHGIESQTEHTIRAGVVALCRQGYIRQKEDAAEHDWVYRLTNKGRAAIATPPATNNEEENGNG